MKKTNKPKKINQSKKTNEKENEGVIEFVNEIVSGKGGVLLARIAKTKEALFFGREVSTEEIADTLLNGIKKFFEDKTLEEKMIIKFIFMDYIKNI